MPLVPLQVVSRNLSTDQHLEWYSRKWYQDGFVTGGTTGIGQALTSGHRFRSSLSPVATASIRISLGLFAAQLGEVGTNKPR